MPPVDAALIGELFERHAAALTLYASQWTTSADDCVQEALVELTRQQAKPANAAAWLYRVVRNKALNAARSSRRRTAYEEAAAGHRHERLQTRADVATFAEVADALESLEPTTREIVVLRIWGGLSWEEIAEVAGGSKSSAQRHYIEGLEQLRRIWEQQPCPKK